MNFKKFALTLPVLLCFAACSSVNDGDDDEVLYRYDDDGSRYSPATLGGSIEYLPTMKSEKLRVVKVDSKLNPKDSFEIAADSVYSYSYTSRDYTRNDSCNQFQSSRLAFNSGTFIGE